LSKLNLNLLLGLLLLVCSLFLFFQIFSVPRSSWMFWAYLASSIVVLASSLVLIAKPTRDEVDLGSDRLTTAETVTTEVNVSDQDVLLPFVGDDQSGNISNLKQLIGGDIHLGGVAGWYEMIYRDTKGNIGNRDILLYALVERDGELELDTFSRNNRFSSCRTYKADNIEKLRDISSGEVIEDNIVDYLYSLKDK
jgi:hypothetical protein